MAIKVIENDPRVIGVILRADLDYKSDLSPWRLVDGIEYRLRCRKVEGMGWGAWTNGAAIWDRDLLGKEFGPQSEAWGDGSELEYAKRIGAKCELWGVSRLLAGAAHHWGQVQCWGMFGACNMRRVSGWSTRIQTSEVFAHVGRASSPMTVKHDSIAS